ncbi:MAG: T9SS type A sorting domain-containing protein [Balneolaceae bacterium]
MHVTPESSLNEQTPTSFTLNQNYPNPFNPSTVISFDLPQTSDVQLDVYDLLGRNVAALVSDQFDAGTHEVNFNAQDLSSGMYLYRLQAGSQVLTRKLTLIK